jgi:hypothetical protein
MSSSAQTWLLGWVVGGRFCPLQSPTTEIELVTIPVVAAEPVDENRLDLSDVEGRLVLVSGDRHQNVLYAASLLDSAPPILGLVAAHLLANTDLHALASAFRDRTAAAAGGDPATAPPPADRLPPGPVRRLTLVRRGGAWALESDARIGTLVLPPSAPEPVAAAARPPSGAWVELVDADGRPVYRVDVSSELAPGPEHFEEDGSVYREAAELETTYVDVLVPDVGGGTVDLVASPPVGGDEGAGAALSTGPRRLASFDLEP